MQMDDSEDGDVREVNKANLLNYQSDDSDEDVDGEDSDAFDTQIKKQKEDLLANDAWGSKKKNFYGRDKKRDVSILVVSLITYIIGCVIK